MLDFKALRRRQPGQPIWRILWWHLLHALSYLWIAPCYHYRAWGVHHIPRQGPVILISNHQSFLDPILVGLAGHHRQFYAMARSTLFEHPVLSWLIRSLNAIPINRNEADTAAMRKCLDVLHRNHALLVFPEGTRTLDGSTQQFSPGTMLLIKRSGAMVVPVAIEGAFDAWPKGRSLPRCHGRIGVQYGQPIEAEVLVGLGARKGMAHLQEIIETMRQDLAARLPL
jgi:1-acyl-sn-glycerol-3-phosphate acyltransferase